MSDTENQTETPAPVPETPPTEAPAEESKPTRVQLMREKAAVLTHDASMDFASSKGKNSPFK